MGKVKRAGDLLSQVFSEQFDAASLDLGRKTAGLLNCWAAAANNANIPAASDHSRIRELEHGVVVIEAEHPGWVQILQTRQSQLLKILQKMSPELEIRGLSFCLSKTQISQTSVPDNPVNNDFTRESPEPESIKKDESVIKNMDSSTYESLLNFKSVIQKRNKNQAG